MDQANPNSIHACGIFQHLLSERHRLVLCAPNDLHTIPLDMDRIRLEAHRVRIHLFGDPILGLLWDASPESYLELVLSLIEAGIPVVPEKSIQRLNADFVQKNPGVRDHNVPHASEDRDSHGVGSKS